MAIPAECLPQFDELYVISDLHMGGERGFQIFDAGDELAWLIGRLRKPPGKKVALVINGDMVDFLAERPPRHFDPLGAVDKLERIAADPAFAPVWTALRAFTATKNRSLIVSLGNHDLELALPWVRSRFLDLLSGGSEAARGRITLAFDGAGFLCRVGQARVLCVHGNEVDPWNPTDHEKIRKLGRDAIQGKPEESWIPNAGTQLVIDVMNDLKHEFRFVDLLKPEKEAVLPILAALVPDQRHKLRAIAAVARRYARDKLRKSTGLLGAEEAEGLEPEVPAFYLSREKYAEALLHEAEERLDEDPMSLVGGDRKGQYLGTGAAVMKWARKEGMSEILREALEELREDSSFDTGFEDEAFTRLDEKIGGDVDFLVAGHTHLERALPRRKGRGWYFNSGTWVLLIRLEKPALEDKDRFRQFFEKLKARNMDALETLVLRRLTVVAFWSDRDGTHGELRHVSPTQGTQSRDLETLKDSRFTVA